MKFIIVWGMHRSGTSLIARSLKVFGANLGDNLLEADCNNVKGYFEDKSLMQLDDAMLKHLGLAWDSLTPILPHHIRALAKRGYFRIAQDFLLETARRGAIVALKDPRMTMLAPFWKLVFEQSGISPISMVVVRHPYAVTESLRRRALSLQRPSFVVNQAYGALLWLRYTLSSLLYTATFPRTLIRYENFMENPDETLKNTGMKFKLPINNVELDLFCSDFVEKKLDHGSQGEQPMALPGRVMDLLTLLETSGNDFPKPRAVETVWPLDPTTILLAGFLDNASDIIRKDARMLRDPINAVNLFSRDMGIL